MDEYRRSYHTRAARIFVKEGIAPSGSMGEAIASLILIDKGLENPETVKKESTTEKLRRKLGEK